MADSPDERAYWRRFYAAVIVNLALLVAIFYALTKAFA